MRVVIADDEAPARDRLRRLAEGLEGVEVAGEAADGAEAVTLCHRLQPELALLDIRMPGTDGLEAARALAQMERPPAIVFVTAYDEHALEAFEAEAVDYLLKPVRRERLEKALARARRPTSAQLAALGVHPVAGRSHLRVRLRGRVELIPVADVLYFRAEQKYVVVRHRGGEALLEESLKGLEKEFGAAFVRVHRNALVARSALSGLERGAEGTWHAVLRDSEERPEVSRRHLPAVRQLLQEAGG